MVERTGRRHGSADAALARADADDADGARIASTWTLAGAAFVLLDAEPGMRHAAARGMRPDADLQKLVMQSLASDPSIDETAIGVSVRHGVVTLGGFVASYDDTHHAAAIVHRLPGVFDVANDLGVGAR